jgi:glycosyltransferase involved in cell wall biosynthesis
MTAESAPRVALFSLSAIADDPRVRKQGDALASQGFEVVGFGLSGAISPPPAWRIVTVDDAAVSAGQGFARSMEVASSVIPGRVRNAFWLLLARLGPSHAERAYWRLKPVFGVMADLAGAERWNLIIANDWPALGAALKVARQQKAAVLYDTHEFATDEYNQRGLWRFFYQPFLRIFESWGAGQANAVSCVSDGIADALQQVHGLATRPVVIRNIPQSFPIEPTPARQETRVLYHGIVAPGRGLEACIASTLLWPEGYDLTIRGPGSAPYLGQLRKLAAECGTGDRVTFAPPVAMTELVAAASLYDVGLFSLPGHSLQNRYVLPNKFFEYVCAGLSLCVSDLPEMRRLVIEHGLGELIPGDAPEDIAQAIGKLDRAMIERYRGNARAAAHVLSWEREKKRFLELCDETMRQNSE